MRRKIESYIYEVIGKRVVSYMVMVLPGSPIGRYRSLSDARRIRDDYLSQYGEPTRYRRPMGTGFIGQDIGCKTWYAAYNNRRLGSRATREECEELLREYIASLPTRTWYSGHGNSVARTLPVHKSTEDGR